MAIVEKYLVHILIYKCQFDNKLTIISKKINSCFIISSNLEEGLFMSARSG